MQDLIQIDGSSGEGGGQVLRSSLALSAATGRPFRIDAIRAGRKKPGLMRQHLTCVQAVAALCGAEVAGAELGSTALEFRPGAIVGGEHRFEVGTAGSTALVVQAVLPVLLRASAPSRVVVTGGTHVDHAPPYEYLSEVLAPLLSRLGPRVDFELRRPGFFPAGGGEVVVDVEPAADPAPLELLERGERTALRAVVWSAGIPDSVAERERKTLVRKLDGLDPSQVTVERPTDFISPGNAVSVVIEHAHTREVTHALGRLGRSAEKVASDAAGQAKNHLRAEHPVGHHLADQLLVPLACLAGGRFRTGTPTPHTRTNLRTLASFTGERPAVDEAHGGVEIAVPALEP